MSATEPGRTAADGTRQAIHDWIREDVPLAGKMNLMPGHVDKLIERLAALRSEARAAMQALPWRDMRAAPHSTPIVAKHKPNEYMPHGWVGTITLGDPEVEDDRFGNPDTILHYNGDRLIGRFYGCWEGWLPLDESAGRLTAAAPPAQGEG